MTSTNVRLLRPTVERGLNYLKITDGTDPARAVPRHLSIHCARVSSDPRALDISVSGDLVNHTATLLNAVIVGALEAGAVHLNIDLGGVVAVDRAGFVPLVMARRRLRHGGGQLRVVGVSPVCVSMMKSQTLRALPSSFDREKTR